MRVFDVINTSVELGRRKVRATGRAFASYLKKRVNHALYGPLPNSEEPSTGVDRFATLSIGLHWSGVCGRAVETRQAGKRVVLSLDVQCYFLC